MSDVAVLYRYLRRQGWNREAARTLALHGGWSGNMALSLAMFRLGEV